MYLVERRYWGEVESSGESDKARFSVRSTRAVRAVKAEQRASIGFWIWSSSSTTHALSRISPNLALEL